jgi:UDP-N-acetylmuramyl pentapeptide synthase
MAANDLIILEEGSPVLNAIASVTRARIITYRLTGNVRNGWRVQNVRERNGHQTFAVTDGITTKTIETTIPGEGSRQAWLVAAIVENAYGKQEHDARAT